MRFTDVIKKRRMVRNFSGQPVDTAMINLMLDLARRGPSAGYAQGQSFVVVFDPEVKKAVAQICRPILRRKEVPSIHIQGADLNCALYQRSSLPQPLSGKRQGE